MSLVSLNSRIRKNGGARLNVIGIYFFWWKLKFPVILNDDLSWNLRMKGVLEKQNEIEASFFPLLTLKLYGFLLGHVIAPLN